jgi:hypothetical protein
MAKTKRVTLSGDPFRSNLKLSWTHSANGGDSSIRESSYSKHLRERRKPQIVSTSWPEHLRERSSRCLWLVDCIAALDTRNYSEGSGSTRLAWIARATKFAGIVWHVVDSPSLVPIRRISRRSGATGALR